MPNTRSTSSKRSASVAFFALLAEVPRAENVTAALAETLYPSGDAPPGFWKSSKTRHIQMVLEGKIGKPSAEATWLAGETAYASGEEWCSGLLFLFSAGHFERFGKILWTAKSSTLTHARKAELVGAMRTAANPTLTMTEAEYSAKLKADGISDTSAREALKAFRTLGNAEVRTDRLTGTLSGQQRAALKDASVLVDKGAAAPEVRVALATCWAAEHATVDVAVQRDIAATALWHLFISAGPGW